MKLNYSEDHTDLAHASLNSGDTCKDIYSCLCIPVVWGGWYTSTRLLMRKQVVYKNFKTEVKILE